MSGRRGSTGNGGDGRRGPLPVLQPRAPAGARDGADPHPPAYWRSLAELRGAGAGGRGEFPDGADEAPTGYTRRDFVKLLGASAALAGVQACERPVGQVLPYVHRPPEVVPGVPVEYATTMVLDGYGVGLLAQSREGRPVKLEGNPDHPASLGAAGVFEQAAILQLYDPHRGRLIREGNRPRSWDTLVRLLGAEGPTPPGADRPIGDGEGQGLRVLLEPTASPFRIHWIERVRSRFPAARFHYHAPAVSAADVEAARRVLGRPLVPRYDLSAAEVVVALDADVLDQGPGRLRYARDFATARRIGRPEDDMNRLYAAEPMMSPTGAMADHHLPVRAGDVPRLAAALATAVIDPGAAPGDLTEEERAWVRYAARDLRDHGGRGVVIAGPAQPPDVHALAYLLNARLGNLGRTQWFIEPPRPPDSAEDGLETLVRDMEAGRVRDLLILDANPVYTAPADLPFRSALDRVSRTVCLAMYENETARACDWYVPAAHFLESWGDARAYDGTLSPIQPLIRPLHEAHSVDEVLAALAGRAVEPHRLIQEVWREVVHPAHGAGADFRTFWQHTLRRGVVPGSAAPRVSVEPDPARLPAVRDRLRRSPSAPGAIEVSIRPDPRVHDGRFANNGWLLELPDPVTKLTWENAALLAPATAARLDVASGDVVRLRHGDRVLEIPALEAPGHAPDSLTVRLGYGRTGAEATAHGAGVSAYRIRTTTAPSLLREVELERVMEDPEGPEEEAPVRVPLATTQTHWSMEGREIVLEASLDEYRADPDFTHHHRGPVETLYEGPPMDAEHQWGMTIDLALCTGCSACVVACQAENNIPIVGKQGVLDSREMHWIRVDRYLTGSPEEPEVVHQPMLCQHCEKAPCEYVCPVNATVHSDDGLNEMLYQRCVGTRFCSNNCAWKVRRFNWFDYNAGRTAPETLVLNPDVTVRERGVMEKCTYCVQRIRRAEQTAEAEGRPLATDEVRTACQQACPTRAITFGDLRDPDSEIVPTRDRHRIYSVLHELGTVPRTQYLARIGNPNAALRAEKRRRTSAGEERPR